MQASDMTGGSAMSELEILAYAIGAIGICAVLWTVVVDLRGRKRNAKR